MSKKSLLLICGGRSAEHEVSLVSAANVLAAVDRAAFAPVVVGIDKAGAWWRFPADAFAVHAETPGKAALAAGGEPVALACREGRGWLVSLAGGGAVPVDVAFPVLHGTYGEDGTIQGLLAMMGIPFVGCDHASSAVCMDKALTKAVLRQAGVAVAPGIVVTAGEGGVDAAAVARDLGWPVFVKPARLGSSVGIAKVHDASELRPALDVAFGYDDKVLVEGFMAGREIECAVLGNDHPEAAVPGEIVPHHEFYSYAAKYLDENGASLEAPARLDAALTKAVQETAIKAYKALGCTGMARVDFFLMADGSLAVNEINTIPGFTRISMYPRLWQLSGLSYPALVSRLIRLGEERHAARLALCTERQ